MKTFRLTFDDDGLGAGKYVEFEGDTPASALVHLQSEQCGRRAGLSSNGRPIAWLTRASSAGDLWLVEPRLSGRSAGVSPAAEETDNAI